MEEKLNTMKLYLEYFRLNSIVNNLEKLSESKDKLYKFLKKYGPDAIQEYKDQKSDLSNKELDGTFYMKLNFFNNNHELNECKLYRSFFKTNIHNAVDNIRGILPSDENFRVYSKYCPLKYDENLTLTGLKTIEELVDEMYRLIELYPDKTLTIFYAYRTYVLEVDKINQFKALKCKKEEKKFKKK